MNPLLPMSRLFQNYVQSPPRTPQKEPGSQDGQEDSSSDFSDWEGYESFKPSSSKPSNDQKRTVTVVSKSITDLDTILSDWSGQGSHVDFLSEDSVPLKEGRFLGHGVMGGVYETTIKGHAFAWKRRFCRRKIGEIEKKEIEILKKLSHMHITRLIGTYTHRQHLGLLLFPVATCDLHTLFEDLENFQELGELDRTQQARRKNLGLGNSIDGSTFVSTVTTYLCSKVGCLVTAVEYLHEQKIRHKDLKPSNILLGPNDVWLTDFGSATDFSMLSQSATDSVERGTPKYFAPEVASFEPHGRAADMFSLGCVLLEISATALHGLPKVLEDLRPHKDRSFHANMDKIREWLRKQIFDSNPHMAHLLLEVDRMLERDPTRRPTAKQLRERITSAQKINGVTDQGFVFFLECCRNSISLAESRERDQAQESHIGTLRNRLARQEEQTKRLESDLSLSSKKHDDIQRQYIQRVEELKKQLRGEGHGGINLGAHVPGKNNMLPPPFLIRAKDDIQEQENDESEEEIAISTLSRFSPAVS